MSRMMSRACAGIALLVLVLGLFAATAVPASASSSTALTAQYPWKHNGCTGVTDTPAGASFTYACNHHDGCYGGHWADRATCDSWFRNDMLNACRHLPFEMISNCAIMANVYYYGVRIFGQKYYDSSGAQVRISTPMNVG